jgi:hypothetical protein
MSEPHSHPHPNKRVKFSKTSRRVFEKYGVGFDDVDNQSFLEGYETVDFETIPEAEMEHHTVIPESIKLLMEYGPDNMDMKKWSYVTGYKPPTVQEKLDAESAEHRKIVISDELLSKQELDEFIELKTANHLPEDSIFDQQSGVSIAFNPPAVQWELWQAEELKKNMDPFFLCPDMCEEFTEFVLDLAILIDSVRTLPQWKQKLKPNGFEPYNKQFRLSQDSHVDYWASRSQHAFLLLVFSQRDKKHLRLHTYFFLRPKEPKPAPRDPEEEENQSIMESELFT